MANLLLNKITKFSVGDGSDVINALPPTGVMGIEKSNGHTGFYIHTDDSYTLWFYDGAQWVVWQSIDASDANYSGGFTFAWGDYTHAAISTTVPNHSVKIEGKAGYILVDSTPGDATQAADSIISAADVSAQGISRKDFFSIGSEITGGVDNGILFGSAENALEQSANLTFDGSVLAINGQVHAPYHTLTDAANIAADFNDSNNMVITLSDNRTLDNPSNLKDGASYTIIVKQDATGSRTLAFGDAFKWSGGTAPTLSTAADAVDILTFISDGTYLYGSFVGDLK